VVAVVGEVDLTTAPVLRNGLLRVVRELRPEVLDVDLTAVTFLDCAGVGALAHVRRAALRATCEVRITNPRPVVRRVLDLTGQLDICSAPINTHGEQRGRAWACSPSQRRSS
jgi:anti-anti-sigma factor